MVPISLHSLFVFHRFTASIFWHVPPKIVIQQKRRHCFLFAVTPPSHCRHARGVSVTIFTVLLVAPHVSTSPSKCGLLLLLPACTCCGCWHGGRARPPARRLDEVRLEMSFGERGEEAAVPSFFSQFNFASFP